MGLCVSKSSGTSMSGGRDAHSAISAPPRHERAQNRNARQARSDLAQLSDLNRSRPTISAAGSSSIQARRTGALPSTAAQAAVTDVLRLVRETYYKPNLKSGNKVKGDGGPEEFERQQQATDEVERMRMEDDPLEAAMQGRAHQCQELTLLAVHHLQERGLRAQVLELGGDDVAVTHNVAVIGPASNPLPADMKKWHPDVYLCDPWSNIACRAKDYPEQFANKMKKWEGAGKLVGFMLKGFVLPTDRQWMHDVLHGRKEL